MPAAPVDFGERDEVVDVQLPWIGEGFVGVGVIPSARQHFAAPIIQNDWLQAFLNQNLLARILAVAIRVDPASVKVSVIRGAGWRSLRGRCRRFSLKSSLRVRLAGEFLALKWPSMAMIDALAAVAVAAERIEATAVGRNGT